MASFDFIEASSRGYDFVWSNRGYLARVSFPVIFVKIACFLTVFVLGAQNMYLRQGLILMPGHVLEALLVVGVIRYILFAEPIHVWGNVVLPKKTKSLIAPYEGMMPKRQAIQAAIAMYLLLKVFETSVAGMIMDSGTLQNVGPDPEVDLGVHPFVKAMSLLAMFGFLAWSFRLLWLYIPLAMGFSMRGFLKKVAGLQSSIFMIATWFVCFAPPIVFLVAIIQFSVGLFPVGSASYVILKAVLESCAEIILLSVQVAAMTHGFVEVIFGKEK